MTTANDGTLACWCAAHRPAGEELIEVHDWRAIGDSERERLDLGPAAADLDLAIRTAHYGPLIIGLATAPTLLSVLREIGFSPNAYPVDVEGLWTRPPRTGPRSNEVWTQTRPEGVVPITRSTHLLPDEVLIALLPLLQDPRARAFVEDILWCASSDRAFAQAAMASYLESLSISSDDDERAVDTLHFFSRGLAIASTLGDSSARKEFFDYAKAAEADAAKFLRLLVNIEEFAGPVLPDWWTASAKAGLRREGSSIRRNAWISALHDAVVRRAAPADREGLHDWRLEQLLREARDEGAGIQGWVAAQQAVDYARRHVPTRTREAEHVWSSIDVSKFMIKHEVSVDLLPETVEYQRGLLEHVRSLPTLGERFRFLGEVAACHLFGDDVRCTEFGEHSQLARFFPTMVVGNRIVDPGGDPLLAAANNRWSRAVSHYDGIEKLVLRPIVAVILFESTEETLETSGGFGLFDAVSLSRLRSSIVHMRADDCDTACHLLAPLVERVVKRFLRSTGARPIAAPPAGGGRSRPGTLGTLLAKASMLDPTLSAPMSWIAFLTVDCVEADPANGLPEVTGTNTRNDITHGEGDVPFGATEAIRLMTCLAYLANFTLVDDGEVEDEDAGGQRPPASV